MYRSCCVTFVVHLGGMVLAGAPEAELIGPFLCNLAKCRCWGETAHLQARNISGVKRLVCNEMLKACRFAEKKKLLFVAALGGSRSVNTVITNSASLISQPGFSFVECNFAVDFSVSIQVFMYVERKKREKKNWNLKCHWGKKKQTCESVWCIKKKPALHDANVVSLSS